jgi:hypothetical protein
VAVDLPCDDPTATFETYADVVATALDAVGAADVVVVGNSFADGRFHSLPSVGLSAS